MLEFKFDSDSLERALKELTVKEFEPVVKGLGQELWNSILTKTPQYFGRLTASWSYSVNTPITVDRSSMVISDEEADRVRDQRAEMREEGLDVHDVGDVRYRGHPTAIRVAYSMSQGNASNFKLGDTIYFANGANHGEGAYSEFIETVDPLWLRVYNRPGAMVRRTAQAFQAKYENGVSENQAERVKRNPLT